MGHTDMYIGLLDAFEEIATKENNLELLDAVKKEKNASRLTESADNNHRYKVVAADENDETLFLKDTKGIKNAEKVLSQLTTDKIAELGATQVYITRDDDKEVYLKFINDDGSEEIIEDNIELEYPVEDRDTIFNSMQADLSAESGQFVGHLRKMSRKGKGYVGFDEYDMGFKNGTWYLSSPSMRSIEWAKEVADFYGYKFKDTGYGNGKYHAEIYCPGISDDPKLIP